MSSKIWPVIAIVLAFYVVDGFSSIEEFVEHGLVTDVLSVSPKEELNVTFPGNIEVLQGNVLTTEEVEAEPELTWLYDPELYYTVVMADADPPSRVNPEARSFLHWLVVNVPGDNIKKGQVVTKRLSSNPGLGNDYHRYYFLVYEQPKFLDVVVMQSNYEDRRNFEPDEFASLNGLGEPLAGNFYLV